MAAAHRPPVLGSLALIALVIGLGAALFAYTAGWLSPRRLTPEKVVAAFAPPTGPALGHRRNHAKGICFTGIFEANGQELSFRTPRFSCAGGIRCLGASISRPSIRTRRMQWFACGAWDSNFNAGRPTMAQRHDRPSLFHGLNATCLLRTLARVGEQGPERNEGFCRGPSGVREVRRLGQDRALDRQLRRGTVQQPQ